MTTNQVLAGVGPILVIAVAAQVLASNIRIPALIILLPAGFIAGAVTTYVNPQRLLVAGVVVGTVVLWFLLQLIIGVLLLSISATVTPRSLRHLILPTLGLVAPAGSSRRPARRRSRPGRLSGSCGPRTSMC